MNQEREIYGYGDDFFSIDKLTEDIEKRRQSGVENLFGLAIFWEKNPEGSSYPYSRVGLCISRDGSISTAHAELE